MVDLDFTMLNPPGTAHFLSISDILRIAAEIEFHPSKKLGQNFLHDANTVRKIVRGAEVHPGDCVFEVGAGMGSLTLGLLNAGARVIAAEVDYRLAKRLLKTVGEMPASEQLAQNLCILEQNALTVFQQEFLNAGVYAPNKMVSNLPYNIAVPVIFHTLWNFPSIKTLFVMVQKEIGDRLCQRVDVNGVNKSAVGQKIAYFGCAKLEGDVSREVFWPKPGVDSVLVSIKRWEAGERHKMLLSLLDCEGDKPGTDIPDKKQIQARAALIQSNGELFDLNTEIGMRFARELCKFIDHAFLHKRKKIKRAVADWCRGVDKGKQTDVREACADMGKIEDFVMHIVEKVGVDLHKRAQDLRLADFVVLLLAIKELK